MLLLCACSFHPISIATAPHLSPHYSLFNAFVRIFFSPFLWVLSFFRVFCFLFAVPLPRSVAVQRVDGVTELCAVLAIVVRRRARFHPHSQWPGAAVRRRPTDRWPMGRPATGLIRSHRTLHSQTMHDCTRSGRHPPRSRHHDDHQTSAIAATATAPTDCAHGRARSQRIRMRSLPRFSPAAPQRPRPPRDQCPPLPPPPLAHSHSRRRPRPPSRRSGRLQPHSHRCTCAPEQRVAC